MNTESESNQKMVWRRGELLAELFLQEFNPAFLARPTSDLTQGFEYDYFIGFSNPRGGLNTYGVEVKATQRPIKEKYQLRSAVFKKLAFANIPSLLLVVDVKHNEVFYSWLTENQSDNTLNDRTVLSVPIVHLDEDEKVKLRAQMVSGVV